LVTACQDANTPTAPAAPEFSRVGTSSDTSVIVVLKSQFVPGGHAANQARAAEVARGLGLAPTYAYGTALFGFSSVVPKARLDALQRDRRVPFVSADGRVEAVAQTLPTGIDRIQADASSTVSGNGSGAVSTGVAIIDTGIDPTHPDLNVVGGFNCSTGCSYADGNGHGTHVSGTVAAKDDGNGVVGVAPGAPLWAVRVLNNAGSGSWSSVACGIDWVTANAASRGIKVANMSLGGSGSDDGSCGNANDDACTRRSATRSPLG
jgi:subtilisin family serine protease